MKNFFINILFLAIFVLIIGYGAEFLSQNNINPKNVVNLTIKKIDDISYNLTTNDLTKKSEFVHWSHIISDDVNKRHLDCHCFQKPSQIDCKKKHIKDNKFYRLKDSIGISFNMGEISFNSPFYKVKEFKKNYIFAEDDLNKEYLRINKIFKNKFAYDVKHISKFGTETWYCFDHNSKYFGKMFEITN